MVYKLLKTFGKVINAVLSYGNLEIRNIKHIKPKSICKKETDLQELTINTKKHKAIFKVNSVGGGTKSANNLSPNLNLAYNNRSDVKSFVLQADKLNVNLKSSLIEYHARKRGLQVKRLSRVIVLVETRSGKTLPFNNMNGISSSVVGRRLCDNKIFTRKLLSLNGISVPESEYFPIADYDSALNYFKNNRHVVVKPTTLARGKGVSTNITCEDQFIEAWELAASFHKSKSDRNLLIEKHIFGEDFRAFVVRNRVISFTHRRRTSVLGDGKSTIEDLIVNKNILRSRNLFLRNCLIPLDIKQLDLLEKANLDLLHIPKKDERFFLRSQSNLSAGGDSIDFTDVVHPSFLEIAIKSVKAVPGMAYAGVDIITKDPTQKATCENYVVTEVEYSPGPLAHFPFVGEPRNMADAILDYYLKESD